MSVHHQSHGTVGDIDDPVLQIRNASVTFDMERGESRVLNDVSIDIERREILGIVGESGSGKSMFASALLDAVVDPGQLSGEVTFHSGDEDTVDILDFGEEQLRRFRWEHVSMVFQGAMSSFNPTTTIETHFTETLLSHERDREQGMAHARELLSDLYLEPDRVLESYPHELSGGMKQRALIALSLVLEPEVLVMDEPTAALDLLMQRSILSLLEGLQEKYDLTLVFITHDLALVAELADRMGVMYGFSFAEVGETDEIMEDAAHPYTRALLNSVPNLEASVDEMEPIEGSSPDPVNVPAGCSYHPRCPLASEECRTSTPEFYSVSDSHNATCHHWENASEEIPFTIETDGSDISSIGTSSGTTTSDSRDDPLVKLDKIEVHFEESGGSGLLGIFDDPDVVHAVDGVNLDIYENDVVALVGESGCGKTTLGKAAVGLQRPTGGTVNYRGQDVWAAKEGRRDADVPYGDIRRSLQIIHQDPGSAINPYRKVVDTLSEPLRKWYPKLSTEDRIVRIHAMLETVGITPPEDYAQRYPHQLSGGEKQRVALIRALLLNPDLILADEAISALDVSLRVETMDLLLELQEQFNTSFLFISHDLSNARYLAEKAGGRIGIMYLGELVEIGSVEQIINNPQHPYTQVLRWAAPDLTREMDDESPLRTIDIPDPINPPSGCRFHTRCPEARTVCTQESPELAADGDTQRAACFRTDETHDYWESESIIDE